jgi:Protein of unknown function (DUF2797)
MSTHIGNLQKLKTQLKSPIDYTLSLGDELISLNSLLQKTLHLKFLGEIHCIHCQRRTSKSFQQGFCYPCFQRLRECNLCIIHPERCKYPEVECPDDWAHAQCSGSHIVYLANTSGLKVGITRETQMPVRWIDQGAVQALPLFRVRNRRQSGMLEVILKQFVFDKTNWQQMLRGSNFLNLKEEASGLLLKSKDVIGQFIGEYPQMEVEALDREVEHFEYPVLQLPEKLSNLSLDKSPEIRGVLLGIKGQYLIFDVGALNIRKYGGYKVVVEF